MPQPKLKEADIFSSPLESWTPERLALMKELMHKRITKLREARNLKSVADTLAAETPKKKKKKSVSEEIGLDGQGTNT